jgi:hypothetical protein
VRARWRRRERRSRVPAPVPDPSMRSEIARLSTSGPTGRGDETRRRASSRRRRGTSASPVTAPAYPPHDGFTHLRPAFRALRPPETGPPGGRPDRGSPGSGRRQPARDVRRSGRAGRSGVRGGTRRRGPAGLPASIFEGSIK